jgi:hypothetical protein
VAEGAYLRSLLSLTQSGDASAGMLCRRKDRLSSSWRLLGRDRKTSGSTSGGSDSSKSSWGSCCPIAEGGSVTGEGRAAAGGREIGPELSLEAEK